ncbi:MAG: hypothetical protein ACU0BF_03835 [Paracoccaceae bacterium]
MRERALQGALKAGFALAFYHGRGTWQDAVVRRVTGSVYSHVELVWLDRAGWPAGPILSVSASPRDGGVRLKSIAFHPARWDLVAVPWAAPDAWAFAEEQVGAGYDWPGVILRHGLRLPIQSRTRWFCSELCAAAVGLREWDRWTPGGLALAAA